MTKLPRVAATAAAILLPVLLVGAAPAPAAPRCTITGTNKAETLRGTARADVICGLGGDDTLLGLGGNDTLLGGAGNDRLTGGAGIDVSRGEAGDDQLSSGPEDVNDGGIGTDRVIWIAPRGVNETLPASVENSTGTRFADVIRGNASPNALVGGAGNDTLSGGLGNDSLDGGLGRDTMRGDAGNDTLAPRTTDLVANGGAGTDTASFTTGVGSSVNVDLVAGRVAGGAVAPLTGLENVTGSRFDDSLVGNGSENVLDGGAGADMLYGGDANDTLSGGAGADHLLGENGNDSLTGGADADTLDGGAGVNPCIGGDPGTFQLDDTFVGGACEDVTAPLIVSVTRTPAVIDTRTSDQTVTYTVRLVDDLSGFSHCRDGVRIGNGPASFDAFITPTSGGAGQSVLIGAVSGPSYGTGCDSSAVGNQVSVTANATSADGRPLDVTWVVTAKVGQFSRLGAWTTQPNSHVSDLLGNGYGTTGPLMVASFPGFTNVA